MEIEVEEYVRTIDGVIAKLTDLICGQDACFDNEENICKSFDMSLGDFELNHVDIHGNTFKNTIVKHSKNIIDLIEVGDYVNGKYVIDKLKNKINDNELLITGDLDYKRKTVEEYIKSDRISILRNANIKTIVTKEQFKSVEYGVK